MSIGLLLIILFVQRPEDIIDQNNGILSGNTYEDEIRKIIINKQPVQIAFVRFVNSVDVRSAIGEVRYEAFINEIAEKLTDFFSKTTDNYSIYFGALGCFYVIFDDPDYDLETNMLGFVREYRSGDGYYYEYGARFITKFSNLRFPEDLGDYDSILAYSRLFPRHMGTNESYIKAADIVATKDFKLEVVIEGVETEEQLETLKSMGADYIQGFYFSRPLSELQFLEFLDRHNRREE